MTINRGSKGEGDKGTALDMIPIPGSSLRANFHHGTTGLHGGCRPPAQRNAAWESSGGDPFLRTATKVFIEISWLSRCARQGSRCGRTAACPIMFTAFSLPRDRMVSGWLRARSIPLTSVFPAIHAHESAWRRRSNRLADCRHMMPDDPPAIC
jgi:hypothetical protein